MKILIVEDDLEISKLLADFLQGNGYEVLCQYDGLHVLDCIQEHQIDLILLDIMLPYRSGDTILADIRIMALVYPVAGCIRESVRFGITEAGNLCYQVSKAILYSLLLNSATFLIAIWIVLWLRSSARAIAVTALVTFVLSLYLGYGMMFDLPVAFLATYQIREAVFSVTYFLPWAILVSVVWIVALITFSWISFRKCELK